MAARGTVGIADVLRGPLHVGDGADQAHDVAPVDPRIGGYRDLQPGSQQLRQEHASRQIEACQFAQHDFPTNFRLVTTTSRDSTGRSSSALSLTSGPDRIAAQRMNLMPGYHRDDIAFANDKRGSGVE